MMMLLMTAIILMTISTVMILLSTLLSKKSMMDREKGTPFECGFDPKSMSRVPFSLRFFLIAIIFLIFDVEIVLLFPMVMIFKYSKLMLWFYSTLVFMLILIWGLYHEWNQGALEWNK